MDLTAVMKALECTHVEAVAVRLSTGQLAFAYAVAEEVHQALEAGIIGPDDLIPYSDEFADRMFALVVAGSTKINENRLLVRGAMWEKYRTPKK